MSQLLPSAMGVVWLALMSGICHGASYTFQGPNFTTVSGTQFSTSDSLFGTMTINTPPLSGTCTGLGNGAGECDIIELSLTASGSPPVEFNLGLPDLPSYGSADWSFTFDGAGAVTSWRVVPGDKVVWQTLGTNSFALPGEFGTYVNGLEASGSSASTAHDDAGAWSLVVPEPSSIAISSGLGLVLLSWARRRH